MSKRGKYKEHVLKYGRDTNRKQRNIRNNTVEEQEELVQIFKVNKKKEKKEEKKFRKKVLDLVVLYSIVNVLALNWSAQSHDLCWRDTSSSHQREEPQEPQFIKNAVEKLIKRRFHFHVARHVMYS